MEEDESSNPSAAKRSFHPADEEACTNDFQLHRVAIPTTVSLSQVDGLTLSNVMSMLTTANVSLLMQTGDRVLRLKLASHIRRLRYLGVDLPKFDSIIEADLVWLLPEILTHPTPRLTSLVINRTGPLSLSCDLTHLPPTLTHFSLFSVRIIVSKVQDMIFNLPALLNLRISSVQVRISEAMRNEILYPSREIPDHAWVVDALRSSLLLRKVSYTLMPSKSSISSIAVASLPLLEDLEVKKFAMSRALWPPNLHTLTLTSVLVEDVCSIPDTVTDLQMYSAISNDTLATWLSMAPSSLLHLRVKGTHIIFGDDIWLLIARFTNLQTLQIEHLWDYDGGLPLSLGDLSLLPNTIKTMSPSFTSLPSQWSQLPVSVSFIDKGRDAIVVRSKLPCYWSRNHVDHVAHFPKKLQRLCLRDSFLPPGLDALRQLHIDLSPVAYHMVESTQFLQHVPSTLVVLSIDVKEATSLFSFAGVNMAERFPLLSSLCLRLQNACLKTDTSAITEWLSSVPKSVRCLELEVFQVHQQVGGRPVIYLDKVVFPTQLSQLCINARTYLVQLPALNLPNSLHSIDIHCFDIATLASCDHIAKWPLSLKDFTIAADTSSIPITTTRCRIAKTKLEERIGASKHHKFTLRPAITPFS